MKLSELKTKLGLAADATEAQVVSALDAAVTLANEAVLANAGTSEGVKKAWETRKGAGSEKEVTPAEDERFVKDRNPALPKRETPAQAGYNVVHEGKDTIHVQDKNGKKEEWAKNDGHASYGLRHKGHDYEFVTSSPEHFSTKEKANESKLSPAQIFISMVNELARSKGMNFNDAWANVKMEHPEKYQAMLPAKVK